MNGQASRLAVHVAKIQQVWSLQQFCRRLSSRTYEVDEINKEMADVFGVPLPPEGTCLAPNTEPTADGGLHSSLSALNTTSSSSSSGLEGTQAAPFGHKGGPSQWQASAANTSMLQQLQHSTQQLQQHVQRLEHLLREHSQLEPISSSLCREPLHGRACLSQHSVQQEVSQFTHGLRPSSPPDGHAHDACSNSQATGAQNLQQQQQQCEQQQLSHVDASGRASMVDVADKTSTGRIAKAQCRVLLGPTAFQAVASNAIAKGDVLRIAQIAGIQGAKSTSQLIPLCHNIFISSVKVDLQLDEAEHAVHVESTAKSVGQTGVEMEALTGAAIAALTVYDMTKAVSKGIRITDLQLEYKEGGKSGTWRRDD